MLSVPSRCWRTLTGADKMRPQRRGRDLQPAPAPQHGVVVAHLARLLDAQDLIEVEIADRDKGRAGLFRRHRKARVVGRHKHLAQIAVGGGDGGDPGDRELLGQPVLKRAERPLRAADRELARSGEQQTFNAR